MIQEQIDSKRWLAIAAASALVLVLATVTVVAAIYLPQVALFVPIVALALAFALQKYMASFFSHFVITFSKIYDLGDRIRIGDIKGDVLQIGLLTTTLQEIGEDEKLGGEVTGRLFHVPNLIILDQPVLNYSKDYLANCKTVSSDYMYDEVRIPISTDSNVEKAAEILEGIVKSQDETYVNEVGRMFRDGRPRFLDQALNGHRVLVYVEPERIWIKGKFVTPLRYRNELRSSILLQFFKEVNSTSNIKLA